MGKSDVEGIGRKDFYFALIKPPMIGI